MDIEYVVSPFEADAQLAYLESQGVIQAVITEDSDLLAFGCKEVIVYLYWVCKRFRIFNVFIIHVFSDRSYTSWI